MLRQLMGHPSCRRVIVRRIDIEEAESLRIEPRDLFRPDDASAHVRHEGVEIPLLQTE